MQQTKVTEWAQARGYDRYLASSIKEGAAIDWSDKGARRALLAGIVADGDRLLELAWLALGELAEDSAQRQRIVAGAEFLGQLLHKDIERNTGEGAGGVKKDRMVSVHDPEMRHGQKAAIVVDTDT